VFGLGPVAPACTCPIEFCPAVMAEFGFGFAFGFWFWCKFWFDDCAVCLGACWRG